MTAPVIASLRHIAPSPTMLAAWPALHAKAEAGYGKRRPVGGERWMIDADRFGDLHLLTVYNAKRHRDEDFGWTALWVLREAGHVLHCQPKRGLPTAVAHLTPGVLVLFDSRTDWHWTSNGKGMLVLGAHDFSTINDGGWRLPPRAWGEREPMPSDDDVRRAFDDALAEEFDRVAA